MEQLTKQQIILLALLVSFVSSIATGIVTVSLMDQAPPAVSSTINRVVERTIERVTPSATSTKEIIVIKDDQAVVDSVAKASRAIVRIADVSGPIGIGVIMSSTGLIVSSVDAQNVAGLTAHLYGGNVVPVSFVSRNASTGLTVFQAEQGADRSNARAYTAANLGDSDALSLGQSVVHVGGVETPVVATGILSSFNRSEGSIARILTSVRDPAFDSQTVLVNLLGEVIGLKAGPNTESGFIPSNIIKTHATI